MLRNKDLFEHVCTECRRVFRSDKEKARKCPSCQKFGQKNRKQKKKPPKLSLTSATRLLEEYNQKHHTNYTYGQFINLLSLNQISVEE